MIHGKSLLRGASQAQERHPNARSSLNRSLWHLHHAAWRA
ncbi:hypothetical protein CGMCC3_g10979 [Colletotrichum fructicola]|nr:uncharacterized protein CGMCC3_g10979 [Colletotrichum fructicola]KAE9572897.1 hypothetical protein CGMCC3_g10979 [Colletotrichum fructicola]